MEKKQLKVSIIIITLGRKELLNRAINTLHAQTYPKNNIEIIVVEETNKPAPIEEVKYISIPENKLGFPYARNIGVKDATGDIILFMDDDCEAEQNWVSCIINTFSNDVYGVAGAILVKDCGIIGQCENVIGFPGGGLRYVHKANESIISFTKLSTCNCAYRKSVFDNIGNFNESLKQGGEDSEFAERVTNKFKCVFNPKAIVYHKPKDRLIPILNWFIRRGAARQVEFKNLSAKKAIVSFLKTSVIFKLLLPILLLLYFDYCLIAFFVLIVYYLYMTFKYRYALKYYPASVLYCLPIVKIIMDIGYDIGQIKGYRK